jgi:hypothetical protein
MDDDAYEDEAAFLSVAEADDTEDPGCADVPSSSKVISGARAGPISLRLLRPLVLSAPLTRVFSSSCLVAWPAPRAARHPKPLGRRNIAPACCDTSGSADVSSCSAASGRTGALPHAAPALRDLIEFALDVSGTPGCGGSSF